MSPSEINLSLQKNSIETRIEYRPIERLVEYPRNPRKNDAAVDRMCGSIREFGFKIPCLVRSDGEVVDGHLRLKAARKLGISEIPVILCDEWSPAQVKAFRLMVNRSVTWADWDDAAVDSGKKVLVEGTQGSGLSLYHSPHYPKTTSRDTNAAAFMSEVGLSPRLVSEVVLVFRTFPIRVSGAQAGPLSDEFTWEELQLESNSPTPVHEYTSVTRKLRRLGRFDWESARAAIKMNRPTRLALNFTDYLGFENRFASKWDDLNSKATDFVLALEKLCVPVMYIGTGSRLSQTISRDVADPCPNTRSIDPFNQPSTTNPIDRKADLRRS